MGDKLEEAHAFAQWYNRDILQNAAGFPLNNNAFNPRHMIGHPNFRHVTHWMANARSFFGDANALTTDVVKTGTQPQQRNYQAQLYDRYQDFPQQLAIPHHKIEQEHNERSLLVAGVLIGLLWIYMRS